MSFRSHLPVRRRVFRVKLRFSVSVNFCRCFFVVVAYSLYVFSWSLSRVCAQFDCYNLFLSSLWRPSNWLTHMQRHALLLTRFWGHQVMVRGNDVEICVGGRGEGGGRDSCHTVTNTSLCERTCRDEGLWRWRGGPPSPHSCDRPVTQDVIMPPHLDWVMGFWSGWASLQ